MECEAPSVCSALATDVRAITGGRMRIITGTNFSVTNYKSLEPLDPFKCDDMPCINQKEHQMF
jgi:hypothetical protein